MLYYTLDGGGLFQFLSQPFGEVCHLLETPGFLPVNPGEELPSVKPLSPEVLKLAKDNKVALFRSDVIYKLIEDYKEWARDKRKRTHRYPRLRG